MKKTGIYALLISCSNVAADTWDEGRNLAAQLDTQKFLDPGLIRLPNPRENVGLLLHPIMFHFSTFKLYKIQHMFSSKLSGYEFD